jgi:DNA repair protein RecO (recombination protein O)
MYLLEFCAEFLEDRHPNPDLFFLLLSALYVLEKSSSLDWVVSGFEVQAMAILGYAPQIAACVSCGRPAVGLLRFSAPMGGVVCGVCSARHRESIGVSAQAIEAIGLLGELELAVLGKQEPPPGVETEVRGLLRAHIRSRAEREMRSTRFIDQLRTL